MLMLKCSWPSLGRFKHNDQLVRFKKRSCFHLIYFWKKPRRILTISSGFRLISIKIIPETVVSGLAAIPGWV